VHTQCASFSCILSQGILPLLQYVCAHHARILIFCAQSFDESIFVHYGHVDSYRVTYPSASLFLLNDFWCCSAQTSLSLFCRFCQVFVPVEIGKSASRPDRFSRQIQFSFWKEFALQWKRRKFCCRAICTLMRDYVFLYYFSDCMNANFDELAIAPRRTKTICRAIMVV
jgi:hypothetical protein